MVPCYSDCAGMDRDHYASVGRDNSRLKSANKRLKTKVEAAKKYMSSTSEIDVDRVLELETDLATFIAEREEIRKIMNKIGIKCKTLGTLVDKFYQQQRGLESLLRELHEVTG